MKRSICGIWLALLLVGTLDAQRLEHQPIDSSQVLHISTSLNHVTVFEMHYPVTKVVLGSRAFKSDWQENIVNVEPLVADVQTDLQIWTQCRPDKTCRYVYELDPAGPAGQAIIAIDQPVADPPAPAPKAASPDRPPKRVPSPVEVLASTHAVVLYGSMREKNHVVVYVKDLLTIDGRVLVRYTIKNKSRKAYLPGIPEVVALEAPRFPISLVSLTNCQIGSEQAEAIGSSGASPVSARSELTYLPPLSPGQEVTGMVSLPVPSERSGPTVLRFTFPNSGDEPITATLVL